jgi:hypothetical protein
MHQSYESVGPLLAEVSASLTLIPPLVSLTLAAAQT